MQKPYIARDTGEPLVVMGAYSVGADGGVIRQAVAPAPPPFATDADLALLAAEGEGAIRQAQLYGVLDRLFNAGLIRQR